MRNMIKALLIALLEPTAKLQEAEQQMDFTQRLALLEELKSLPWPAVWDRYCVQNGVPTGIDWLTEVRLHEKEARSRAFA
jgi:L-rhamnose isomerase